VSPFPSDAAFHLRSGAKFYGRVSRPSFYVSVTNGADANGNRNDASVKHFWCQDLIIFFTNRRKALAGKKSYGNYFYANEKLLLQTHYFACSEANDQHL
jgi:hypothetical protein